MPNTIRESNSVNDFIVKNRIRVNGYLNNALLFFIITGPAIALGIKTDFFPDIKYSTCFIISAGVAALAIIHKILLIKLPKSIVTSVFALTALDAIIVYMSYSHVSILLTWFLVPLLSLLFVDKMIYFYSTALNYALMFAATYFTAPYHAALNSKYENSLDFFLDRIGGFTIETLIMFAAGYTIAKLVKDYFGTLFMQYETIKSHEEDMGEKLELLNSMVEIYDNVNLINFIDNTEMPLRDPEKKKRGIDMTAQTHTIMNQRIKDQVMPDQLDAFLTFTNIKTVRARLSHKKLISADFIDVVSGWFRAQYITVDSTLDGIPNKVIYTTRNVDEEKQREEHLIRLSMTDEMTRLYNRRCYEEDLEEYRLKGAPEDLVIFSIDVNGLKTVNDTKGHAAGDELIKGAADCLALSVRNFGKVYRTGGDEFMAIVSVKNPESIREEIKKKASEWHGMHTEEMTMSIGYAQAQSHKSASIDDLERIADADMYSEKEKFYKERGIDRRR